MIEKTDDTGEMRALLYRIGWSQRELARQLGVNNMTIRRMANGDQKMSQNLLEWLRKIDEFTQKHPPPAL